MNTVTLSVTKEYTCDVLVAGGGVTGLAAAVSAARMGAKTILCDGGGVLGGTATKGMVGPFMTCYDKKGENQIIKGFFEEFVKRMADEGGAIYHTNCKGADSYGGYRQTGHIGVTPFSPETFKRVAEQCCVEAGVRILYHSTVIGCETQDDTIRCAYIGTPNGLEVIHAKTYIDCTGSATLAAKAGAEVVRGDENGMVQTSSLFFRIRNVNKQMLDEHMAMYEDMHPRYYMHEIAKARAEGRFPCGTPKLRIYESVNGEWVVNMAQEDDPVNELDTAALTDAEISQRTQIPKILAVLKVSVPALKDAELVVSGSDLGVRESRRMVGLTTLTGEDVSHSRYYDERIAVCANSIDIHQKNGVAYVTYEANQNYYIPLSCLISRNIKNLMGAGKCMSADKYAFAAVRVMPPCFAMGEAAGITAALSLGCGGEPAKVDVKAVQAQILENGGYLE